MHRTQATELGLGLHMFVETTTGDWAWVGDSIACQMPLPRGAVAFGATLEAVASWTVETAPYGLDAGATVGDAARSLLAGLGIHVDVSLHRLWLDVCSDLMARAGEAVERDTALRLLREFEATTSVTRPDAIGGLDRPTFIQSVPPDRPVGDGRSAAEGRTVQSMDGDNA
jgi:hypothetical protein